MNNNKRGISTIVATVLIVLITVAAVTILWSAISPLIDRNLSAGTACFDAQNALKIDTNRDYTCFDEANDIIKYRMERSANDVVLDGADVYFDVAGTTDVEPVVSGNLPGINSMKKGTDIGAVIAADEEVLLSIAPKIIIDGEPTICEATAPIKVSACVSS